MPKTEINPFSGKKQSVYTPTSQWLTIGINTILESTFNEKQRKILSDAKILVNVYGDWSGEIKYVDFLVPENNLKDISLEDLDNLQKQIKKIKAPLSENLSLYSSEADYFKLTSLLKYQSE